MSGLNALVSNRATVTIPGLEQVSFSIIGTPLPGITATVAEQPSQLGNIMQGGSTVEYENLELEFQVSDDLSEYKEVSDWLLATHLSYADYTYTDMRKQITMIIVNAHYTPTQTVVFHGALPEALSSLQFSQEDDTVTLTATVTVRYSHYEFA